MTVLKIRLSSKVTGSKLDWCIFKINIPVFCTFAVRHQLPWMPKTNFLGIHLRHSTEVQVCRVGYIAEIMSSTSPGNEFLGNSLAAFRAVDMERRKRIPRESVFDRAKTKFKLFLLRFCLASQPASQQVSQPASQPTRQQAVLYPCNLVSCKLFDGCW